MKFLKKPANLPFICGGLGILGMALRFWLLTTGYDDKGLLLVSHPATWLTIPVSLLAVAAVVLALYDKRDTKRSTGMFRPSIPAAAATAAVCVSLAITGWNCLTQAQTLLFRVTGILGIAAASAAAFLAYCRFKGLRPHFLMRSIITLFLMLYLVRYYQQWFAEPQPALYCTQLFAHVMLMVACFHRTALESGADGRRMYILTSQLAGFLCLMAIPGSEDPLFHLTMGTWMLVDTGRLWLPAKQPAKPAEEGENA